MKKMLLGLALGLSFAGIQASLFSAEVSECLNTGKTLTECRQLEAAGQLRPAAQQIGFSTTQTASSTALPVARTQRRLPAGMLSGSY